MKHRIGPDIHSSRHRWIGRVARIHRGLLIVLTTVIVVAITLLIQNFTAPQQKTEQLLPKLYGTTDPQFDRAMSDMLGPSIVDGNRVRLLRNGDEIFPAMLDAIRSAKHSITFESFIYYNGRVAEEFTRAFAERARAGAKVHLILDWVGSDRMNAAELSKLHDAGVQVSYFNAPSLRNIARLNNRTHRKLLIVDGRIGFIGGVGIAEVWEGRAQDPGHWRDNHFIVEGPVVAQMQSTFMDHAIALGQAVSSGDVYFPPLARIGNARAHVFRSAPQGGNTSLRLMYLLALTAANQTIKLSSSYFVPDDLVIKTLIVAAQRGVKIQVIVPGPHADHASVRGASRQSWGPLLEAGIEIYEYQPTMYHCKVIVIDDLWTSVGSTNFDDRSLMFNDEANLNVYDSGFAGVVNASFAEDLQYAKRVTLEDWRARPWTERAREWAAEFLKSQL